MIETNTKANTKTKLLPLPLREGARGRGRYQVPLPPKPRGNRSCIGDRVGFCPTCQRRTACQQVRQVRLTRSFTE